MISWSVAPWENASLTQKFVGGNLTLKSNWGISIAQFGGPTTVDSPIGGLAVGGDLVLATGFASDGSTGGRISTTTFSGIRVRGVTMMLTS
jgi:hypothetical protein